MNKSKGFTKSIAFTLVLAMLFATLSFGGMAGLPGVPGAGGAEAYGAESITATVRIEGPDGVTILPETEGAIVDGVTTIGGFVAEICNSNGLDFELNSYGYPGTIGAINNSWMSRINDSDSVFNIIGNNFTNVKLANGDQVVLYPNQTGIDYATFGIGDSDKETIDETIKATRAFTLLKYAYDEDWNMVQSVVENATLTVKEISDETTFSAITNSSGQAILRFEEGEYEVFIESDQLPELKITKPYARILVDTELNSFIKSPILKEVGIEKFEVEIGDGQLYDMKSRIEARNTDINISQSLTGITVTAIPISGDANISISPGGEIVSGEPTYIEVGALVGSTGIDLTVRNDRFSQKYSFYINIVPPSVDNDSIAKEINSVINATLGLGISNYASNYSEYVMSLEKNGIELPPSEKEAFLEAIMRDASSESVGKLGKMAAALSVLGIDPREVPDVSEGAPEGQTIDILELMSQKKIEELDEGSAPYALPYVLLAFDSGVYSTTGKINRTELIDYLLSKQASSGGFPNPYTDVDTTAIYLIALSPYYKALGPLNGVDQVRIDKIKNAVNKSLLYILQNQAEFGRYAYMGASSSNTTSMVIAALSALGIDPHASPYISDNYSAVQGLLSFKTGENLIAIKDSLAPNELSNIQGAMALVSYNRYVSGENSNLFVSEKPISVYDEWPTEILKEINVQRENIEYKAGEAITSTNLTVTAIFSSQGGIRTEVIPYNQDGIAGYAIAGGSPLVAGGNNITISFRGKSLMFIQNALNADGTAPQIKTVALTVKDENNRTIASQGNAPIQPGVTSVIDALIMTLNEANVPYTIPGGTYVSSINGLGEFDLGPYSGWLYQVDGNTPSTTGADQYKLTGGERVTWYYTKDFTKDPSSSAWVTENQAGAVQDGLVSVTTDVKAVTGSDGTAKATVSTTQLDTAVTDALKAAAVSKDDAKPAITIAIEADSKAQGVETVIPKAAFANLVNKGIQQMTIESPLGNMMLDLETLKDIVKGGTGDISLSIKKAEESQGRPVIRLEINNGGKTVGTFGKPITITVPYTPVAGENEQGIAVFHLDDSGQWKNIKASKYDSKNKAIVFRTDHFSDFVIAYSHKTFGDIKGHWAQTPIEYLASRRIIQGMTEESFAPNGTITRAQFVTLLAGMAGADLSQYSLSQFNDVKDNAWYKGAVTWAAENGIVQGQQAADGSFWFNPNQNISRQDMAVVMMRYLAWAKEPVAETTKAIAFKDGSTIASYAKESVTAMQKAGLINGRTTPDNQTVFDPTGKLTRAEAAQILTNQLYKQF